MQAIASAIGLFINSQHLDMQHSSAGSNDADIIE